MTYCVTHPEEIDKIAKVKAQVSEVKGVMMENIEKVSFELEFSQLLMLVYGEYSRNLVKKCDLCRSLIVERRLNSWSIKLTTFVIRFV